MLPTLFISHGVRHGRWSDRNVGARRPRLLVLAFITASVAAGLILLLVLGAPPLLTGYLAFMLASVAVLAAITTVWKISIHCAVASGSVMILAFTFGPLVLPGYPLVGLLGWSRVAVKDHSVAQVVAGAVLGAGAAGLAYTVLVWLAPRARAGALTGRCLFRFPGPVRRSPPPSTTCQGPSGRGSWAAPYHRARPAPSPGPAAGTCAATSARLHLHPVLLKGMFASLAGGPDPARRELVFSRRATGCGRRAPGPQASPAPLRPLRLRRGPQRSAARFAAFPHAARFYR